MTCICIEYELFQILVNHRIYMTSGYECFAEGFFFIYLYQSYEWCFYQYTCTIMSIVAGLQLTNSYLRKASLTQAVFRVLHSVTWA